MKAKRLFFSLFVALAFLFLPASNFAGDGSGSGGGYNGYNGGGEYGGGWGGGYYPYYWGGYRYWGWGGGYWRDGHWR